jgi:hypothetical protein
LSTIGNPLEFALGRRRSAMSQPRTEVTGWVGWVWYAALMLMIVGGFNIVQGIIALADNTFAVGVSGGLLIINLTTWAWVHIVVGMIMFLTGVGLWSGQTWARVLAVIVASLNAIVQLTIMPAYPFWAVLMVALNMVVIYAVVVHGREAQMA